MTATGMHAVQRICILVLESALSCDFASLPEIYACADTNNMLQLLSSSQAAQGFNSQVGGGANISVALLQASYSKTFKIWGSKSLRVWRNTLKRLCPPNRFSLGSTHGSIGSRLRAHIPRVLYIALSLFWLGWFPDTTALDKHQQAPLPAKISSLTTRPPSPPFRAFSCFWHSKAKLSEEVRIPFYTREGRGKASEACWTATCGQDKPCHAFGIPLQLREVLRLGLEVFVQMRSGAGGEGVKKHITVALRRLQVGSGKSVAMQARATRANHRTGGNCMNLEQYPRTKFSSESAGSASLTGSVVALVWLSSPPEQWGLLLATTW
ncbi:hypothetical protein CI102_10049 [Trichoderma harzianum]|nr:hypothetical protein CI102_10049 [Trichoderma harzianum]